MRALRHTFCGISICLCLLQVSALKVVASYTQQPLNEDLKPSDRVLEVSSARNDIATSTGLRQSVNSLVKRNSSDILLSGLAVWVLVAIGCLLSPWGSAIGSMQDEPEEMPHPPSNAEGTVPQSNDGSFARRYQESEGQEREALTLLLRCSIISQDEFASNCVSEEHIDECVWIAIQMLQQSTLDEWIALSTDGRQSFEDTVAAIYEARENALAHASALRGLSPPETYVRPMISADSLRKGGSSVSLGSSVSFGHEDCHPAKRKGELPAQASSSLPKKSPVPVLNCYEQADVDQMSFTSSKDGEASSKSGDEEDEGGFPSVFSSSSGLHTGSLKSTPAESYKLPIGSSSQRLRTQPRLSLPSQEIMARPPLDVPRSPQSCAASPSSSRSSPIER